MLVSLDFFKSIVGEIIDDVKKMKIQFLSKWEVLTHRMTM